MYEDLIKTSFYITFVFLACSLVISFIYSTKTQNKTIITILMLETCICTISSFFYSIFSIKINVEKKIPYEDIISLRYTDWFLSTPLMLLSLCFILSMEKKIYFDKMFYAMIVFFDIAMLVVGYLGKINVFKKNISDIIGFIFLLCIFGSIWIKFIKNGNTKLSNLIFYSYLIIWSMYGVVYLFNDNEQTLGYNILDIFSKSFVGIFLWMYFTKLIKL
jgi:bacteriorhodopsin